MLDDEAIALKIVVVGNGGVGKSSMIQRFATGVFTRDYKKTIGVDFLEKEQLSFNWNQISPLTEHNQTLSPP